MISLPNTVGTGLSAKSIFFRLHFCSCGKAAVSKHLSLNEEQAGKYQQTAMYVANSTLFSKKHKNANTISTTEET